MRVLLVEDERPMALVLRNGLVRNGMIVDDVASLSEAEAALHDDIYDVVVLDRRLPDGDGLSLVKLLRVRGNVVPVLVLTAKGDLADRVAGLDSGADDYLGKPFAFDELLARLRAILRRPVHLQPDIVSLGRMSFDFVHREANVQGAHLRMPRRELLVLEALMRRMGRMVLRETLMEAVFGMNDEIESNALDTHISRVRRKLADAQAGITIDGIRGVGYLLRETV
ncbi:response regulator transcription factor [Rhizobium sp. P40RR-XXII]|uniref:response regulator transcription factor n=1 Tax=unclassified Rhizobium TaxID=2613769 RepID=UPI0014576A2D|nr:MULTISPECIES: response regulator transcription factor [unclassified Rhizobium]NLR84448.1 response regulator transcription factor [Rhizobium sp. P28RR-XV]NLS16645.1 response regulator transcription factor [Rhizobium sp. P40RR-XXII]